jgi:pre-rRNA-processing protein TSR4
MCAVCGIGGNKLCSKCVKVTYCSKQHQLLHWQSGHKELCGRSDFDVSESDALAAKEQKQVERSLFPSYEIVSEAEDLSALEREREELNRKYGGMVESADADDTDPDGGYEQVTGIDKAFLKFTQRIEACPDQVLRCAFYAKAHQTFVSLCPLDRYARVENLANPEPLWASASDIPVPTSTDPLKCIPKCELCGAERTFEFQVTSPVSFLMHICLTDDPR